MNEKLKPCPFCGHEAELKRSPNCSGDSQNSWVECKWCGNRTSNKILYSLAIEQWNMRTNGWIPVSKRLPTEEEKSIGGYVLGSCPAYCIPIPVYCNESGEVWRDSESLTIVSCEAWQPLPESYQP